MTAEENEKAEKAVKGMTTKQFVAEMAEQHGLTLADARERMDQVFDTVIRVLVSGKSDRIMFSGFGLFEAVVFKAKNAWNLATNTRTAIPARRSIRFRPSIRFREMMRGDAQLPVGRSAAIKAAKTKIVNPAQEES